MESNRHYEPNAGPDEASPLNLQDLLVIFREKLWVLLGCGLLGLAVTIYQLRHLPQIYTATAVLQIEPRNRVLSFEPETMLATASETGTQTTLELFKSRPLLHDTVLHLGLQENPAFFKDTKSKLSSAEAIEALASCFWVKQRRGTQLLDITASHTSPEMAFQIANGVTDAFFRLGEGQRTATLRSTMSFLISEADRLKARLQKSEEALQSYREANNAVAVEEKQDTVTAALKTQANNLAVARANRIRLETDADDMERFNSNPAQLLTIASIAQHPAIASQRNQINELLSKIATLNTRYTDKHPKLIQSKQQLLDAENTLRRLTLQIPETVRSDLERAIATERNFERALKEQERQSLSLNRQSITYHTLVRDVETDRSLYESIVKRLKETDVERGIAAQNARILEAASLPLSPDRHKKTRLLAIGLVGGLLAGGALVFGGYFLNSSWRSIEEIENATGLPVLASIPKQSGQHMEQPLSKLALQSQLLTLEAFRSLRTALHMNARRNGKNCFLFTSALPGEGKSFCSAGYALTLARQGVRTLLIDADLRRPFLAKHLLGDDQLPGLIEVLQQEISLTSAIHPTKTAGLDLLPAGIVQSDASELLTLTGIETLLTLSRELYDCIIIDCAPVLLVSDAILLSSAVDAVCTVVRYGVTPKNSLLRALHLLSDAGAPMEGVIFNAVNPNMLPRYYVQPRQELATAAVVRL